MIKKIAAIAAASIVATGLTAAPALACTPGHGHAHKPIVKTNTVCLSHDKLCVKVPATWLTTTTYDRMSDGIAWQQMTTGPRATPKLVTLFGGGEGIGGACVPELPDALHTTVVRTAPTKAFDRNGKRLYAVSVVERYGTKAIPKTYLTSDRALRTTGAKKACVGFLAEFIAAPKDRIMTAGILPDTQMSIAKATAAIKGTAHRAAFDVLRTAANHK